MRRLRIAIASAGRFHMLDVARELHNLGHEVRFYSYVPRKRAMRHGLPQECHVSLLAFAIPFVAWERFAPRLAPDLREALLHALLDRVVQWKLRECDVFHCMSGIYLEAARYAKRRFGARVWLVRSSRHILSQDEILSAIPGAARPGPSSVRRELAGYALADRIAIPSSHVRESFERDPIAHAKTVLTPLGTDLTMFRPCSRQRHDGPFRLLTVGQWSLRKGSNVLESAIKRVANVQLIHVGTIVDLPFPQDRSRFEHHAHVPQWRLPSFYTSSDAFVLASVEEGLAVVLAQALASGLPIICTDRTGGKDLGHTSTLRSRITVVPHNNVSALAMAIASVRDRARNDNFAPPLSEADRQTLSWTAFAKTYNDQLQQDLLQVAV